MLVSGRVIAGIGTGLICTSAPTYIGEIASSDMRGALGEAKGDAQEDMVGSFSGIEGNSTIKLVGNN